jgi:hypothetical protein
LYITREDADNPADKDTVLGPGVSYVDIDQYTGEIVPMTVVNAPDGVGTYLTETYTGYCVDSRGISSNIFSFKVHLSLSFVSVCLKFMNNSFR